MGRPRTLARRALVAAALAMLMAALAAPATTLAGGAGDGWPPPACPDGGDVQALGGDGCGTPPPPCPADDRIQALGGRSDCAVPPPKTPPSEPPPVKAPPVEPPPKAPPVEAPPVPETPAPPPPPVVEAPVAAPPPVAPPPAPVTGAPAPPSPARPAPPPRLRVVKTGPTTVRAGALASFRVRVVNRGRGIARGVRVVDLLPSGFSLVRRTSSPGTLVRGRPTWRIGRLRPGASRVVRVVVRADRGVRGGRCNRAEARAPGARTARDRFCFRIRAVAPARAMPRVTG